MRATRRVEGPEETHDNRSLPARCACASFRGVRVGSAKRAPCAAPPLASRRLASPGVKSLAPGQTNPYALLHWAAEKPVNLSRIGLVRRGWCRDKQGRAALWPSSWQFPLASAEHDRRARRHSRMRPRQSATTLTIRRERTLGWRLDASIGEREVCASLSPIRSYGRGWALSNTKSDARSCDHRRSNSSSCTNAESLPIASDPLLTRAASITPIFTPISWLRRAADGVEMIRRAT